MRQQIAIPAAILAAALSTAAVAKDAKPLVGREHLSEAKVSLAQARITALKARPGTIVDQELEKERGGSGLRYSFDVKSQATIYEVGVDAVTGRVLENVKDGPHPD